ncbi:hypothetical protein GCM10009541_50140 [Micromonospora gifhornensis]|uniref:Uncharacterized protein n=1 Tax=Micromonospora gifhornensis TaxID=84594 RepID=A0ABQ4IN06_9ACTN|nr:hypothetical protein Vgi01_59700 [Micromonospora gifhornensis]
MIETGHRAAHRSRGAGADRHRTRRHGHLRNIAIGWHRITGEPNIARANRRADRRSRDLIDAVTSSYTSTQ